MDQRLKSFLMRLETRTHQLILAYRKQREDYVQLQQKLDESERERERLGRENEDLRQKYDHLRMARYIELCDDDKRVNRQRINKLVREVDKCIAMLKTTDSAEIDE